MALYLTNGQATVEKLRQAGLTGVIVAWDDILHEGPVPAGLDLTALSDIRADFLAGEGFGDRAAIRAAFARRDATLVGHAAAAEVVLWFEHDLYDQLQLLQLLDWFAAHAPTAPVSLIQIDRFPGVARFVGLGQLTPSQLATLAPGRQPVTEAQRDLARRAWAAFRAPDPRAIETLLQGNTAALPLLAPALRRHLEQFPAIGSGLARTERLILDAVADGAATPVEIFHATQAAEPAPFMGDWTFWRYLVRLATGPRPLLARLDGGAFVPSAFAPPDPPGSAFRAQRLTLTTDGERVLGGALDWLTLLPPDRWLGGVHLRPGNPIPRWDAAVGRIVVT